MSYFYQNFLVLIEFNVTSFGGGHMNSNDNIIFSCLLLHNDKLTSYLEISNGNKGKLGNKTNFNF